MGTSDRQLFDLVVNRGTIPRRLALGFPRVPVGVATWLAVSSMIAHVATRVRDKSSGRPWIAIVTRERSARDTYLSQRGGSLRRVAYWRLPIHQCVEMEVSSSVERAPELVSCQFSSGTSTRFRRAICIARR
jgi:hypothetical protein